MTPLLLPAGAREPLPVTLLGTRRHGGRAYAHVALDPAAWQRAAAEGLFHLSPDTAGAGFSIDADPDAPVELLLRAGPDADPAEPTAQWYALEGRRPLLLPADAGPAAALAAGFRSSWADGDDPSLRDLAAGPADPAPLLQAVSRWFAGQGMTPRRVEGGSVLTLDGDGHNGGWTVWVETREDDGLVLVWSAWPEEVPEGRRAAVMELVTRVNPRLPVGAFELDLETGRLALRCGLDVTGERLGEALLARLVGHAVGDFDTWLPVLLAVLDGADPREALTEVVRVRR